MPLQDVVHGHSKTRRSRAGAVSLRSCYSPRQRGWAGNCATVKCQGRRRWVPGRYGSYVLNGKTTKMVALNSRTSHRRWLCQYVLPGGRSWSRHGLPFRRHPLLHLRLLPCCNTLRSNQNYMMMQVDRRQLSRPAAHSRRMEAPQSQLQKRDEDGAGG